MKTLSLTSRKGFSILLALGSIGVLMIIVIGMIQVFMTELKLSRYQYDYILASEQAEGAFEYAMLKVANHREGFQDSMGDDDIDQILFRGSTERTQKNTVHYIIEASTGSLTKELHGGEYLIFPLFSGDGDVLETGHPSKSPVYSTASNNVSNLLVDVLSGDPNELTWSIVGMSGGKNTSRAGAGRITGTEIGTTRLQGIECFDSEGNNSPAQNGICPPPYNQSSGGEELPYFYDMTGSVEEFLNPSGSTAVKDPYLLIYNKSLSDIEVKITSTKPFALQKLTVTTEAKKGNAVQTIRFSSDKSKYYDGLKYAIYDTAH